jgi:hypothetical protein
MIVTVPSVPLNLDTSAEIEERQIAAWRRMTPAEKLALATRLTVMVRELAAAGVRQRFRHANSFFDWPS